jgi:hypothetical protein
MKSALLLAAALAAVHIHLSAQPDVQRSHIAANVPPAETAEAILRRDLTAFFTATSKQEVTALEISPLREGPTQSGTSYPKFYFWVKALNGSTVCAEGAIRVAAVQRVKFDVTDFLPKQIVKELPGDVERTFPLALVPLIHQLAEVTAR